MKYEQNPNGYIVFEDGGINPNYCGGDKTWFPNYDGAIAYAMEIVKKRVEQFKDEKDYNFVIVYEGGDDTLKKSRPLPCGSVVFEWRNYWRC